MHEFTDNQDGVWRIVINVGVVKRVRDTLGVDLMDLLARGEGEEERLLVRLMIDPVLLCDVIYCVCREQADERGASDEDFGRAMAGDAIDAATQALLEEIVAFFPNARDRTRAQTVLQ